MFLGGRGFGFFPTYLALLETARLFNFQKKIIRAQCLLVNLEYLEGFLESGQDFHYDAKTKFFKFCLFEILCSNFQHATALRMLLPSTLF